MKTRLQGDDLSRALKARADDIQATSLRNGLKTKRGAALNIAARELGFRDWNTASAHAKHTLQVSKHGMLRQLPAELHSLLADAGANDPASTDTQRAFKQGFVFSIDVKDAPRLEASSPFLPSDDGWYIAARDIWVDLLHDEDFETGRSLIASLDLPEVRDVALDEIQNYSLFRFAGPSAPASLPDAYALIMEVSFFAPTHIWLDGEFIALSKVPEIRVGGQVVYSTTQPGNRTAQAPTPEAKKLWHLLTEDERKLFTSMAEAEQRFMLREAQKRTPYGRSRLQSVAVSVTSTLVSAAKPR